MQEIFNNDSDGKTATTDFLRRENGSDPTDSSVGGIREHRPERGLEIMINFGASIVRIVGSQIGGGFADLDAFDMFGHPDLAVPCNFDAANAEIVGGDLEGVGHLRAEGANDAFGFSAEYGVVASGHSDIRDVSGSARENPFVGRNDMGVGSIHATDAAIKIVAHGDFFAAGLRVHFDDDQVGLILQSNQERIDFGVGAIGGFHENASDQADDSDTKALGGLKNGIIVAGGVDREVGGTNDVVGGFESGNDFPLAIGMVAQRNKMDAVFEEFIKDLGGQARSSRGVFGVGNHAIDISLANHIAKFLRKDVPTGTADDIADAQNLQFHPCLSPRPFIVRIRCSAARAATSP